METRFFHGKIRAHNKDGDALKVEGWANVESINGAPSIDSYGTVFDSEGFDLSRFDDRTPPMFFNHDWDNPVGLWDSAEPREQDGVRGLWIAGRVLGETERQREVQTFVKQGAAPDLSIGFEPLASEYVEEDGRSYERIRARWLETSIVTIGSNRDSVYSMVRALTHGTDTICPRCLDRATISSLPNIDAACRSLNAHAADAIRRGDRHLLELAASRIEETLRALRAPSNLTDEEVALLALLAAADHGDPQVPDLDG